MTLACQRAYTACAAEGMVSPPGESGGFLVLGAVWLVLAYAAVDQPSASRRQSVWGGGGRAQLPPGVRGPATGCGSVGVIPMLTVAVSAGPTPDEERLRRRCLDSTSSAALLIA